MRIENFRGIRSLAWALDSRFVVLIGPGDAGKSTILDALALALSPSWRPALSDADFHNCDVTAPITIEATVADYPSTVGREDRFGHHISGVAADGTLHDEPEPDDEPVITVRVTVDSSLEPEWEVIRSTGSEGVRISAADRARLGMFRLGDSTVPHLRWSRDSALSRLGDSADAGSVLLEAHRTARQTVFEAPADGLATSATAAAKALRKLGGAHLRDPRPGLEPAGTARANSPLLLHDAELPLTSLGAGSQRIAGIAFQLEAVDAQSIVLVDELELGLEPHRLLHLVTKLKDRAARGEGQVILTTHSPVVVSGVEATDLHVVRGAASVRQVPAELSGFGEDLPQATARSGPAAMLAHRVVVCEGATEVGLCRALFRHWDTEAEIPAALLGTVAQDGNGSRAPLRASCLVSLGYPTALFIDSDLKGKDQDAHDASVARAEQLGVEMCRWTSGNALEDQLVRSLPREHMRDLIRLAAELQGSEESVRDAVAARLPNRPSLSAIDPVAWVQQTELAPHVVRSAIGRAAAESGWFKTQTKGERLGALVADALGHLDEQDPLMVVMIKLHEFVYCLPST